MTCAAAYDQPPHGDVKTAPAPVTFISVKDVLDHIKSFFKQFAHEAFAPLFSFDGFGRGHLPGFRRLWRAHTAGWYQLTRAFAVLAQHFHVMKGRTAGRTRQFMPVLALQNQSRARAAITAGRDLC